MKKRALRAFALALAFSCLPISAAYGCADTGNAGSGGANAAVIPTYTIKTSASQGGTINASADKVQEGEALTVTLVGNAGYVLSSLTVNGGEVITIEEFIEGKGDEPDVYQYTWMAPAVLSNYDIKATFVEANLDITFVSGEGASEVANKLAVYGGLFGTLETPFAAGKRFEGWFDEEGNKITSTTKVKESGKMTLTAKWSDVSDEEKESLKPFSATTAYYDEAATKYGVVWHTEIEPIFPVVEIVEKAAKDFTSARSIEVETSRWDREFVNHAVVEDLEYETEYMVRFGDRVADVWSETYTFTTRAEKIDELSFFYVNDTQETYKIENEPENLYIGDTYYSQLMRDATARFPDASFIAHGGDMVNYGSEADYWQEMLDSVDEYLFNLPTVMTIGNHEAQWYASGRDIATKIFNINCSAPNAGKRGYYYSFDYGPLHFIVLTSNDVLYENGHITQAQLDWLASDLSLANANPNIKWTVAMMHQGPISPNFTGPTSNHHQDRSADHWMPVFAEYELDLLLFGHEHELIATYPIRYDEENGLLDTAGTPLSIVPHTVEKTTYDGVSVDKITHAAGVERRGTVFHQTGASGPQVHNKFSLNDLAANLALPKFNGIYRTLLGGGAGYFDEKARSMYSYLEVKDGELIVRTYGVDIKGLAAEENATNVLNYGVYMDGYILTK